MTATTTIAFASEAFAKRLANLLSDQRDLSGRSVRALARSSGGRFTVKELRAIEAAESPLSEPLAVDLSALYGVDLGEIVQERLPLVIRPHGVVSTGGVSASFTPHDSTSLLVSYLRLVRRLRNAEEVPSITLRRDDVESLAAYLELPGERVIERLAGLMGATRVQRRAMVAMFVAGAVVIGLVGTAAAAIREPVRSSSAPDPSTPRVTVADAAASAALIDGGDWASYLLARLGAGPIPDSLGIAIGIDSTHIEVSGRLADLPPETKALLGPLAAQVDPNTVIVVEVSVQRTGPEVVRFWLRGLKVSGFPFPEFLLAPMMASVGRQYPALTKSGRDLYVQVPPDARFALRKGAVAIAVPGPASDSATGSRPPRPRR